ncbi:uncharacterized protein LOC124949030 isoform X2 [Vespa velutina]|nr:uncharacterized protein LOC124949030 isoform X2 [Vespa velutina]
MKPIIWHKVRSIIMTMAMKTISVAADSIESNNIPDFYSYMGYMFCAATSFFGPWVPLKDYLALRRPSQQGKWWLLIVIGYTLHSFLFLSMSNCWIQWIFSDNSWKWLIAYKDALSFRTSHYFISYMASAILFLGGYPYSLISIVKPLEIELPRSLVQVVVYWNIPMHFWLKKYIFRPSLKYLGKFGAVTITYLTSSLLHGLNFQLGAVLLSLGLYTFNSLSLTMECMEKSHQINVMKSKCDNKIDINEEKKLVNTNLGVLHSTKMDTTPYQDDTEKKIILLKHLLEKDPKAADLKWSLFISACNTYRYDTCLRPFPPMYIKNECKDIEALRKTVELIPPLAVIFRELHEPNVYANYGPAIDLLHWVLIRLRDPYIKSINKENYNSVLRKLPSEMQVATPNLIFQIASAKQSAAEEKWKYNGQGYSTLYAYHGSRLENFHSILHYGLQQNMCKKSLFGKGIYLSSELGVSLPYSPVGYGWGGSVLGSELSCVALCEFINHPTIKKHNSGVRIQNTLSESVPDKYYLVTNSDLVRIRYLLVYSQEVHPTRSNESSGLLDWFRQHKLLTFMLGYVILLASVGLTHNKQVEKYYRLFVQKTGLN